MAPPLPLELVNRITDMADSAPPQGLHAHPLGRSLTIDQTARRLGVSRRTVYNRIRDGRLRTIRTAGGSQRVLVVSIEEHAAGARGVPGPIDDAVSVR